MSLALMLVFIGADTYSAHIKGANGQTPLEAITFKAIDGIAYIVDGENLSEQMSERLIDDSKNTLQLFGGDDAS